MPAIRVIGVGTWVRCSQLETDCLGTGGAWRRRYPLTGDAEQIVGWGTIARFSRWLSDSTVGVGFARPR
jgi:hypothetical protein